MASVGQQQASEPLPAEEVANFKSWASCHAQSVSVDCQDSKGRTALMFAAIAGDVLILHKLLRIGAKLNVVTYQGCSALDYAVLHRCQGCAAALADEGACLKSQTVQELELLLHPGPFCLLQHQEAGIACHGSAAIVAIPTPFKPPFRKRIVVLSKHGNLFHRSPNKPIYDPEHIQLRDREVRRCSVPKSSEQLCTDGAHMHLGTDIVMIASHQGKGVRIWFSSSVDAHVMESNLLAAKKQAAALLMTASQEHLIRVAVQAFLLSLTAPQALITAQMPSCIMTDSMVEDSLPERTVGQALSEWQAPMSDQAQQELLQSMDRNAQQEANVINLAQQLHQVQQVIKADVTPATDFIDVGNALEDALGKAASRLAQNKLKLSAVQAQLQAASPESRDPCSADLPKTKETAEQAVQHYLKVASTILEGRLQALPTHKQHRVNILQQLLSARLSTTMPELWSAPFWSTAEVQQHNEAQLQASLVLSAAFHDTRKARAHLQHCLDRESCLMESRLSPLQQGLTQSAQLMQQTIAVLQQQDLDKDQQEAEAMLRDNQLQQSAQALLLQSKANARTVISELIAQRQKQKDLSKQIARATADREELLIDGKQSEANRVTQKLAKLSASRAALNTQMDTQTQMLASPHLLLDHPELKWEIGATQAPSLGVAQQLYTRDRKLTDFRIISHPAATILEAEDNEGRIWALKRIQGDQQSVREAERMVKLRNHPLIVHLQSVFIDGTAVHLQMPFYKLGNLRSWVEQIKAAVQSTGTLSAMQKAAVRSTMRQLAQAIAYTHQQGVTHRDIKPENVLLQDNGNIALCDFGISKDIISGAYESTMHLAGADGTLAYCAPEAGSDAWKQIPTALDMWSFGIMLLELVTGMLFSWAGDKVAYQPNQLGPAQTVTRRHLPSSDVWFSGAWQLIQELLQAEPSKRPSMDSVLLCPFFTSDRFAASTVTLERKFRVLTAHLNSIRQSANRTPAYVFTVHSEQSVIPDILDVFSNKQVPLRKMFHVQWGPNAVRKPLQEVMDMFLSQLTTDTSPTALFQQCDQPSQLLRSYLPPAQAQVSHTALQQYEACGRVLAKCVLEGMHIPVNFSVALHCMLVNMPGLSSHADECIAMLADFDPEEAQRLRQMLAPCYGDGPELLLTVGSVLGSEDETLLTDSNKEDVACRKVRQLLIGDRHAALDAIRKGFSSLDIADDLEGLSGTELASLFFGEQYLDVNRLVAAITLADEDGVVQIKRWLERFIRSLSEHSVRIFLARSTNKLSLPLPGIQIAAEVVAESSQPLFMPEANFMQLPRCSSYEAFASRMGLALRLGEYMLRTDAQHEQRLTKEEEQAVIQAMGGEVRAGGYYRCTCGFIYAVGECGGPMQQAACPKCGSVIGGLQHRLAAGNEHAGFDGAEEAAWPQ